MIKAARIALSLAAVAGVGATFAACGGVPGNAVATVDGEAIEKQDFSHWMTVAAKSIRQARTRLCRILKTTTRSAWRPSARRLRRRPRASRRSPTRSSRLSARPEYEQLRNQVLQLLISFQWIQGEADAMEDQGHRRRGQEGLRGAEEAELPEGGGLQEVHPAVRPEQRGHPPARQARPPVEQDPRQGRQGQGQGLRQGDLRLLQQEQGPLRPAREA